MPPASIGDAADLLRAAGHADLADRLDDGADDAAGVLAEVRVLRAARVCPVFRAITGAK